MEINQEAILTKNGWEKPNEEYKKGCPNHNYCNGIGNTQNINAKGHFVEKNCPYNQFIKTLNEKQNKTAQSQNIQSNKTLVSSGSKETVEAIKSLSN